MPRYLVERALGPIDDATLRRAADEATRVREERFPGMGWERSYVVRTPEGLRAYCVYDAPDADAVRAHSRESGLPADLIQEIHAELP
jgi:hypothetical protein